MIDAGKKIVDKVNLMSSAAVTIDPVMDILFAAADGDATHARSSVDAARALRRVVGVCAGVSLGLGLVVLVGWLLGIEGLLVVLPGHVNMKSNTALGFAMAGLGLAAHRYAQASAARWGRLLGLAVLFWGAIALAEYAFGVDLRVDQLLFHDPWTRVYPGRMAYLTAFNFCLAGLSLLWHGVGSVRRVAAHGAAMLVTMSAFVAMIASLYGVQMFYGAALYTAMALHTGVGFVVLGVGLLLLDERSTLVASLCAPESGGALLRRSVPLVILLPVALGWIYLQPAVTFGDPRLGMALFAMTLACLGAGAMWWGGRSLTRQEQQRREVVRRRAEAASAAGESERLAMRNRDLHQMAMTDGLTGLSNRRGFEQQLNAVFAGAQRHGGTLSVLMIDIDNFKRRNDTWGHAAGDEVLRLLGGLLLDGIRAPDLAARYGGEEFAVLLPGSDLGAGIVVGQRIREMVAGASWAEEPVTVSIGVAVFARAMDAAAELVRTADAALYRAKAAGKDRVCAAEG
jgi:diguanylate cyclase (GGDEF)-like protein